MVDAADAADTAVRQPKAQLLLGGACASLQQGGRAGDACAVLYVALRYIVTTERGLREPDRHLR